jgi:hypothetical protein
MPFSDMTQITHPTSPATKTSTRNVFLDAQTPNPGHLDQYGGCSPRTLGCFGMKWPFRVRLVTLYSTDPRLILAQIESKSDSHISLVRDQIYSNPWAGRLYMPIICLHPHGPRLFGSGTQPFHLDLATALYPILVQ